MAKPFYRSGESFDLARDILSCSMDVDFSTPQFTFYDLDDPKRQVISSLSDYRFGYVPMHTYPSSFGKSSSAAVYSATTSRIQFDEYLFSSSHHKPIET